MKTPGRVAVVMLLFVGAAACTATENATPAGGDGGTTPPARAPDLNCLQIISCAVECPEGDEACIDACAAKGTPDGVAKVEAFAQCIDEQQCTDSACAEEKCADSIEACVTSSKASSTGTPLTGDAPPGSVPSDLVGSWIGARDGITQHMVFEADGSGSWESSQTTQQSACASFTSTLRTGNVVITDTQITFYATKVVEAVQRCAPPSEETDQPATTETLQWHRPDNGDPNTMLVIDGTCAAKYPGQENCDSIGCPIALYCTSRLSRQ
jgi:hypothetical protein